MLKSFFKILYKGVFILQVLLLFSCYSIYLNKIISPSVFPYFGIMALIFPVLFIAYLITLLLSFFFKRKKRYVFLFLSIPLFFSFAAIYKPNFKKKSENTGLKIISYNAQYAYKGVDKLDAYLRTQNADIIVLQEIYKRHWRKEALLPNNYNAVYDFVGISSKHPIIFDKDISLPDSNGHACLADIVINQDTLRVFNIYLEPLYLTKELIEVENSDELEQNTEIVKNKLIRGFRTHERQLSIIKKYIKESPHKVVVAGDFNAVPNSYEYYYLHSFLTDTFTKTGTGLSTTFHDYHYPIRIDYIFTDKKLNPISLSVDRNIALSDHFPIIGYVSVK